MHWDIVCIRDGSYARRITPRDGVTLHDDGSVEFVLADDETGGSWLYHVPAVSVVYVASKKED